MLRNRSVPYLHVLVDVWRCVAVVALQEFVYDLEFVLGRVPQHLSHQVALQLGQVAPRRRFARALAVIAGEVRHLAEEAAYVRAATGSPKWPGRGHGEGTKAELGQQAHPPRDSTPEGGRPRRTVKWRFTRGAAQRQLPKLAPRELANGTDSTKHHNSKANTTSSKDCS